MLTQELLTRYHMLPLTSYKERYGDTAMARSRFRALPEAIRSVRCGECTSCPISCPNGVRVRRQLMRAQTLLA